MASQGNYVPEATFRCGYRYRPLARRPRAATTKLIETRIRVSQGFFDFAESPPLAPVQFHRDAPEPATVLMMSAYRSCQAHT